MIGSCNCPIAGVRLEPTVRLQFCRLIKAKTAVYVPITFEEIVIVMIKPIFVLVFKYQKGAKENQVRGVLANHDDERISPNKRFN